MNLDEMSLDELETLYSKRHEEIDELRRQQKAVAGAIEGRRAAAAVRERLLAMPEGERAALVQMIRAEGIGSQEEFGRL